MKSRRKFLKTLGVIGVGGVAGGLLYKSEFWKKVAESENAHGQTKPIEEIIEGPLWKDGNTELLISSFLGNPLRSYYGQGFVKGLNIKKKFYLGCGTTLVGTVTKHWCGAGWTGQPTLVRENGKLNLVIGANDHHLRRIDLDTFTEVWKYKHLDVMKGSSSVYIDDSAPEENRIVIMQGSRYGAGNSMSSGIITSFRAVSFRTGKELWKLNITKTESYSRDNDSSAIDLGNGVLFNAGENAIGYFLSSKVSDAEMIDGFLQPKIFDTVKLYADGDAKRHGGNLVVEASPARIGDKIFIASGAGHIYGIDLKTREFFYDFFTGTDIDGTTAVSKDKKLFCAIERQYVPGNGGVLKLDPSKPADDSVDWFLPTRNVNVATWEGGIIGSVAINDHYVNDDLPKLFATLAIDGNIYIGSQHTVTGEKVDDWSKTKKYDTPLICVKKNIGASIATPIFMHENYLAAPTYNGLYLFKLNYQKVNNSNELLPMNNAGEKFKITMDQIAHFKAGTSFEATPIVWDDTLYICCRDGYLYALG